MPILSICIPTYNRSLCLRQCLESILSLDDLEKIEIVISDNASTDDTAVVVGEYQKKYPQIRYTKNETNLGFDRNMLAVVAHATGKYCLFIGDDDAFFPGSIANILTILEAGKAEMYTTNNSGYDIELKNPVTLTPNLSITEDTYYPTLRDFVLSLQPDKVKTVGFFGGMSGQIFLRELWDAYPNKDQYIGTQTIHLFVLVRAFRDRPYGLIAMNTIKTRADNIRWDTFQMNSLWSRETKTKAAYVSIAEAYDIEYSGLALELTFLLRYFRDLLYFYSKKYLFRDQQKLMRIKKLLSTLHIHL